jgi:hypothetical protein
MNGPFRRHGTPASDRKGLVRELGWRHAGVLCYRPHVPRVETRQHDAVADREVEA